jgi:sterol desaturase/sphingolipid hydroxylase (fatty acid hydroxylase superfamily)
MGGNVLVTGGLYFLAALVFSSFVEYWAHRVMHHWRAVGKTHRDHHARNVGQGVLREYWDYIKPGCLLMWPGFLVSLPAGIGWLAGMQAYAVFIAFAHQLQHENPLKCFWMPMPTHYVHHKFNMWHHNFGMSLDLWDRVFGTYKPIEWREGIDPSLARRSMLDIRWW